MYRMIANVKSSNKQKRYNFRRQNITKKKSKGGVAPIILVIENLPTIIMGVSKGFSIMMEWIVTANKTIDNYNTIKKIIKPKEPVEEEKKEPVVVEKKEPVEEKKKEPVVVEKKVPIRTTTVSPMVKKPNKTSLK